MSAAAAFPRQRWLFGPATDLLLGCGAAYAVVFVLLAAAGAEFQSLVPFGIVPLVYLVTSARTTGRRCFGSTNVEKTGRRTPSSRRGSRWCWRRSSSGVSTRWWSDRGS